MAKREKPKDSKPTRILPSRACKRTRSAGTTETATKAPTRRASNKGYPTNHPNPATKELVAPESTELVEPKQRELHEASTSRLEPTRIQKTSVEPTVIPTVPAKITPSRSSKKSRHGREIARVAETAPIRQAFRKRASLLPTAQKKERIKSMLTPHSQIVPQVTEATSSKTHVMGGSAVVKGKRSVGPGSTERSRNTAKAQEAHAEKSKVEEPEPSDIVFLEVTDPEEVARRKELLEVPEGHKLIHLLRHATAWSNGPPRFGESEADVLQIHDPGLTPMGREAARRFRKLYKYHIKPTLIVSSPLRRCLQTTTIAFGPMIRSGEVRAIAHPGLQECSTKPCDTGTPLKVLREEFPAIQFPDELFPRSAWPRNRSFQVRKIGTVYDDVPGLLLQRAVNFRKWLREEVSDQEVIVVTHGGFVHFFFDMWDDLPGESGSRGFDLGLGKAIPMTLAAPDLPDEGFCSCPLGVDVEPYYGLDIEDAAGLANVARDCGIFTSDRLR